MILKTSTLRERRRRATKSEIVRIAFELFARQGYDGVSVEMIAAAAGISRATFFNYFSKKDMILREVAVARAERVSQMIAAHRNRTGSFTREDLMRMIFEICSDNARFPSNRRSCFLQPSRTSSSMA
jgi:AcrR family transcriptional regulator